MKAIRFLLKFVLWTLVVLLVVLLASPMWLGFAISRGLDRIVSEAVKTNFDIGSAYINPYTARVEIYGLQLDNPTNFSERTAVHVGEFVLDFDMTTLTGPVRHISEVKLIDGYVSVVSENGVGNFEQLALNATGPADTNAVAKAEVKDDKAKAAEPKEAASSEVKYAIDRLEVSGLRFKYGLAPAIPIPPLTLTNIGGNSGKSWDELWMDVYGQLLKFVGQFSDGAKLIGSLLGDGVDLTADGLNKLGAGKALDATVNVTESGFKAIGGDTAVSGVKKGAGAVMDAGGSLINGAGDGVKAIGNSLKGLFK